MLPKTALDINTESNAVFIGIGINGNGIEICDQAAEKNTNRAIVVRF